MGFFDWSAPLFGRFADRWSPADAEAIASRLRPFVPEGGRLLDVGGGTGALAARLADALHARVTVLDPTPRMLGYVPDREDVVAVLGRAEEMPFADDGFDAAVSSDAFHHFRDQSASAREMARVVRPGGAILVLDLDPRGVIMRGVVAGERLLGEPGSFFTREGMCEFWAGHDVHGECRKERAVTYSFLGQVD